MNLPILNDPSELTKKHATFDQPFYQSASGASNMLNKGVMGSNENLFLAGANETSSIYDFAKAQRIKERQNRKQVFNKKLNNVYSNATIFKVANKDGRSKA